MSDIEHTGDAEFERLLGAGQYGAAAKSLASMRPQDIARLLERQATRDRQTQTVQACLALLAQGRYAEAAAGLKGADHAMAPGLLSLTDHLSELSAYAAELSNGNLSVAFPGRTNYIAMSVKNLHSKLNHLVWQIEQIAGGDYNQMADYMGDLSAGFNWMTAQLSIRKSQLEYELHHDVQTGLLNRGAFMRQVFDKIEAQPEKCGVMLCGGLDNIKYINETYGHDNGDYYIKVAAGAFREYEEKGALVARIAGDEFAVYLHGFDEEAQIEPIEKDLHRKLAKTALLSEDSVKIRASVGVALYPQDARTVDNLLKYSSHTMFEVKKSDRGAVMRFSAEIYRRKAREFGQMEELSQLIDERQLRFAFQPVVSLKDGSLFGYEALMRPVSKAFSGPLDVLAVAEAQSKLHQLEKLTYEMIFAWVYENRARLDGAKIFFNTISTYFMQAQELEKIHPRFSEICGHMVFEVLENAASGENFVQDIKRFRQQLGALVAIDDYGCGYSNDLRLISIAPNIVKIDRFFIKDIHQNLDKQQLLSKIISYCQAKGIAALAEGIETEAELITAMKLGFTYGQGYYIGMPEFELLDPENQ